MSRLMLTSDLHLGHKNILKFRSGFSSQEEHDETIFENLATSVNKRDSVIFCGDIAFNTDWLERIADIRCAKKTLILGNHDTEHCCIADLLWCFDAIHSMYKKRNVLFTHCPVHPDHLRGATVNIHGHLHNGLVERGVLEYGNHIADEIDPRYINICVEHTDFKPVSFAEVMERLNGKQ